MRNRLVLLAAPALLSLTAAAPPPPAPLPDTVNVAMTTDKGVITIGLDARNAPVTTANFLRYVDQKRFDGVTFYRAMKLDWGTPPNGLIQAGTQGDPKRTLKPIAHEPTSRTGILHKAGAISMARWAPGTAAADFSIMLSDMPGLDADPSSPDPDRQAGFAAFGHVVGGMEVVRAIWESPVSPTKGVGALKGQMLDPPIRVLTVRRARVQPAPAPAPAPPPVPDAP